MSGIKSFLKERNIWVPDSNWTHDLPNTWRALYPLSYENSWRARPFNWICMGQFICDRCLSHMNCVKWPFSQWVLVAQWIERSWIQFLSGIQIFLCPTLFPCLIHRSHFITKLKIHHLQSLITTHDEFNSADPSRMQDTCYIWTQLNDLAFHEFS